MQTQLDKRLIPRMLKNGTLSRKDLNTYLDSLPDLADAAEEIPEEALTIPTRQERAEAELAIDGDLDIDETDTDDDDDE